MHIVDVPTVATALVVCLALSAVLGLLVHGLIFRPLRKSPALGRAVASLGLLLYLQAVVDLRFHTRGATAFSIKSILPTGSVRVLGVVVFTDRFALAALAVGLTLALALLYRYTVFGLATRAAAESEKGAVLVGRSPDVVAAANWVLGSMLAGIAVILAAPISGLDSSSTLLLVVPALAAALAGRLRSFVLTAAGGLAIGMAQSGILRFATTSAWLPGWIPRSGLQQGIPFLVILVLLAVGGTSLPTRGTILDARFQHAPEARRPWLTALVVVVIGTVALLVASSSWRLGLIISMVSAVVCLSFVVVTGLVGQISLAQLAIAGTAGFLTAKLGNELGWGFPVAPVVAISIAGGLGVLAGLPAVRVRGMALAIATLAFATAVEELVFKSTAFSNGVGGISVPRPHLFGLDLGIAARGDAYPNRAFGFLVLAVLAIAIVAIGNLRRSPTGLRWLAVRTNERAAAAAGIDVRQAKLTAFAASAIVAGAGGALLAYQRTELSVQSFVVLQSLALLALTYLAGTGGVGGALLAGALAVGGIVTVATDEAGLGVSQYQYAITGVLLVVVTIAVPDGVVGAIARRRGRRGRRTRIGAVR